MILTLRSIGSCQLLVCQSFQTKARKSFKDIHSVGTVTLYPLGCQTDFIVVPVVFRSNQLRVTCLSREEVTSRVLILSCHRWHRMRLKKYSLETRNKDITRILTPLGNLGYGLDRLWPGMKSNELHEPIDVTLSS